MSFICHILIILILGARELWAQRCNGGGRGSGQNPCGDGSTCAASAGATYAECVAEASLGARNVVVVTDTVVVTVTDDDSTPSTATSTNSPAYSDTTITVARTVTMTVTARAESDSSAGLDSSEDDGDDSGSSTLSVEAETSQTSPNLSKSSAPSKAIIHGDATDVSAKTRFAGVNICGFDFGCDKEGTCDLGLIDPPVPNAPPFFSSKTANGPGQMSHFVTNDSLNIFRLPVGWQYLVASPGGTLDPHNMTNYDQLVQSCLSTGAYCIIDVHNYARWNGQVIGQDGGPSNDQFADLWSQLAAKYAGEANIWFGIMNEPHDLPGGIEHWAATVQAAVAAIRGAGAATQFISIPGDGYQSPGSLVYADAAALLAVSNPDGSATNLVFDVHTYLDGDKAGDSATCVTNNTVQEFAPLAKWLRANNRQAILTETGGGDTDSCKQLLCEQLAYLDANADVFLGYLGWGAGSFKTTYELSLTPTKSGNSWTDQPLLTACLSRG